MTRDYRVLIIEDDAVDRRLYGKLLTELGSDPCHIQYAVNGEAGLAALRADNFDCVLLDFNLPTLNGLEFLTAAAVDGKLPCAIVLITGQGNEALAVEAMKRGVQDYLTKDQINANSLWRAVTQAVSKAELAQRLARSLAELTEANHALKQEAAIRRAAEIELRAAKDAAEQANRAKTRFVATVTHELRTPLNGILGYAQLLRMEGGLSLRQDTQIAAMMQAGHHLLEMIEEVLDFAGIETGRMELRRQQVAVRELVEGCIEVMSPIAGQRGLALRVVSSHDAPRQIVADPARLRQVVLNLLGNAAKFTHFGSVEVRVVAGPSPGGLRIEVADTGPGIDEASRDRLFQDFDRLNAADSVEGAGLGLAIAARIVNLMGGTIGYAANPGGGSIFWLELPTEHSGLPPALALAEREAISVGRRVLLADDIKINRDIIGSFLENAGYIAVMTESAAEAVRLASDQRFDLILMDVNMPGMDGLQATRAIRKLPDQRGQVPILALTAHTTLDEITRCLEAGVDGHLPKPVNYETLIGAIDETITRCQARWGQ